MKLKTAIALLATLAFTTSSFAEDKEVQVNLTALALTECKIEALGGGDVIAPDTIQLNGPDAGTTATATIVETCNQSYSLVAESANGLLLHDSLDESISIDYTISASGVDKLASAAKQGNDSPHVVEQPVDFANGEFREDEQREYTFTAILPAQLLVKGNYADTVSILMVLEE